MWINRAKYDNLLKCLDEAITNNYELRKTCQCGQCKWIDDGTQVCEHYMSDNYGEVMNPYGSCEKCERR